MDRNILETLFDRYLKGETSPQENELIENWLEKNNNPHSQWQHFSQNQRDQWLKDVFGQIQNNTQVNEPKTVVKPKLKQLWLRIGATAAVLIICFSMYLGLPLFQNRLQPVQLVILKVPANQKKAITLADGSRVWINAGSELRYSKAFNGKKREVYLSGEAYFDIHHDVTKPFIIHTGNLSTTVLGTAFNIKEDKNKHTIQVTVTRGKVSVADGRRLLGVLIPNQQIRFNTLNAEAFQSNVNANEVISWKQKDLHFEDVSFGQAIAQLEQHFNVKISISNPKLKNCRFTGTSLNGEELNKILKVMCAFNNATYQTKSDGSILIDGEGCN